jgi:hypothetical protein
LEAKEEKRLLLGKLGAEQKAKLHVEDKLAAERNGEPCDDW